MAKKVWEVRYNTNQEGYRTRWTIEATTKDQAIGKVARMVTTNSLVKGVMFQYVDCINVTEEVNNGTYDAQIKRDEQGIKHNYDMYKEGE